jgi:hypothetical protein
MSAKSSTGHLPWIAAVATFVIACVYIFSQLVVLQKFQPSAENKVNSELATKFARMWDDSFVDFRPERLPEFWTNLQDDFLRRAFILQIDFLRRAFEQLFAQFAAGVVGDIEPSVAP